MLDALPEEQRPIAELALQGLAAVRQRLRDDNQKLTAEGKAPMPEASVLKMAEELLPRLRVAEWLDRAEAARGQIEHLDLRDLRSVVASSDDPMVARDETTRQLAGELKAALATKQEQELQLWFGDIDAALARRPGHPRAAAVVAAAEGRRAVPGRARPAADRGANASLTPTDGAERWCAVLEAAAFSPIRTHVAPSGPPATVADELRHDGHPPRAGIATGGRDVRHRAGRQRVDAQAAPPDRPPQADQSHPASPTHPPPANARSPAPPQRPRRRRRACRTDRPSTSPTLRTRARRRPRPRHPPETAPTESAHPKPTKPTACVDHPPRRKLEHGDRSRSRATDDTPAPEPEATACVTDLPAAGNRTRSTKPILRRSRRPRRRTIQADPAVGDIPPV